MSKKLHKLVETKTTFIGGGYTKIVQWFTSEQEAKKQLTEHKKNNTYENIHYHIDFSWRQDLLKHNTIEYYLDINNHKYWKHTVY